MSSSRLVGRLRVIMGLDDARFRKGLDDAATGMRRLGQDVQRMGAALSTRVTAPLVAAGAAAGAAFMASANSLADLQRQADLAGLSVQDFKEAALTVEDYGIQQDKLADILKDVNDRLGDFRATGAGPMADFFETIAPKVGLTIESFEGLTSSQALSKYITALEDANVSQAEMTFYLEAMASDATALIPAFRDGGAEIAATARRARELGLALDEDLIRSARDTQKDFRIVAGVLTTQFQQALIGLAPAISELVTALMPMMEGLIEGAGRLAAFTARLAETSPETLSWGLGLTAAAAAIGPFLAGVGMMIQGLVSVGGTLARVSALLLANPIGLAVAAVAGAAVLIYRNWDDVGPWFGRLWDGVRRIFGGFGDFVAGIFTGDLSRAVDGLRTAWSGLRDYYQTLWDGIVGVFSWAWENGIKPVTDALGLTDAILRGWNALKAGLDTVLTAIGNAFDAVWTKIRPVVDAMRWVNENWKGISGIGGGREGTIAPPDADVMAPPAPTGEMQQGLSGGTAGIRVQETGRDVAAGYVAGVAAGSGAAYDAGVLLGSETEDGLRDQTETRSPSQLMRRIGGYLVDGLRLGVAEEGPRAEQDMADLGTRMTDAFTIGRNALGDFFGSILEGSESAKQAVLSLIKQIAQVQFINGALGLPGMGAVASGLGSLLVPSFARGTPFSPAGLARLNERGGEILDLPGGTRVIPHDISKRMAAQSGDGQTVIRLQLSDDIDARIMEGAGRAADVRIERFSQNELPGRVSNISQYERERM
ncbi:hypothetical protein [Paracoccus sp. ME4]|uniref:hypothetical protein n=1 Tax=Paracoccus sp. ME4 TaxID=3138066 RepID=UPI00398A5AB4